jgi:hypothetical protein
MSEGEIHTHAWDYRRAIEALRDGKIDLEKARRHPRLNSDLDKVISS